MDWLRGLAVSGLVPSEQQSPSQLSATDDKVKGWVGGVSGAMPAQHSGQAWSMCQAIGVWHGATCMGMHGPP